MRNKTNQNDSNVLFPALALLVFFFLTLTGCQRPDADLCWIDRQICQRPAPLNPYLVLDNPNLDFNADEFGRRDWPASPEAKKYVSSYEIATYSNLNIDRQSINPSGRPINHARNSFNSYSWGQYRR